MLYIRHMLYMLDVYVICKRSLMYMLNNRGPKNEIYKTRHDLNPSFMQEIFCENRTH